MSCFIFGGGGGKGDSGLDFSQVNMEPQYALAGKKFYNKNKELKTGTILNWDGTPLTLMDGDTIPGEKDVIEPSLTTRYIPSGKYLGKPVELAPMAQGSVNVGLQGNTSFLVEKTAGYIESGSYSVAFPPGKQLVDGVYDGPYEVLPGVKKIYLQTAGKKCTQDICIWNAGLYAVEATVVSTSKIEIHYISDTNHNYHPRKPIFISLVAWDTVSSGYMCAFSISIDWDHTGTKFGQAYIVGSGYGEPACTVADDPTNEKISITTNNSTYKFRTTAVYTGTMGY